MSITFVTPKQLMELRKQGTVIIDMRSNQEYCQGHLPYAINLPYESYEQWRRMLSSQLQVGLYCSRGNVSLYVAHKLDQRGQKVYTICGGIHEYENSFTEPCLGEVWEVEND